MKGVKNSTKRIGRICPCGKNFYSPIWLEKRKKYCSKICFYKYRTRPSGLNYVLKTINQGWFKAGQKATGTPFKRGQKAWNEGKGIGYINSHGYKVICIKGKEFLEHRYVIEKYLGRELDSSEIIHHIDQDKLNNSLNNLEILTRSQHSKLHNKLRLCA